MRSEYPQAGMPQARLELVGIEPQSDWPFVPNVHRHFCAELPCGYLGDAQLAQFLGKIIAERFRLLRACRCGKTGPTTLARVSVEGELRDNQRLPIEV